ncbi:MAG: ribonuclease HI [Clostridia bacterium]|nr:ribonuclease HI [Clostridia bacterium]
MGLKHVDLYTDGACRFNPGPGGWGAILVYRGVEKELCGGMKQTTNNQMELTAVIEGLAALKEKCEVCVTTDSRYVADSVEKGWARGWKAAGWMRGSKSKKEPVPNAELWDRLLGLLDKHEVSFVWVRGHNGHPYNERCDALATRCADRYKEDMEN